MYAQELRRQQVEVPTKASMVREMVEKLMDEKYQLLQNVSELQGGKNRLEKDVVMLRELLTERNQRLLKLQEEKKVLEKDLEDLQHGDESYVMKLKLKAEGYTMDRPELYRMLEHTKHRLEEAEQENHLLIAALKDDVQFQSDELQEKVKGLEGLLLEARKRYKRFRSENETFQNVVASLKQENVRLEKRKLDLEEQLNKTIHENSRLDQRNHGLREDKMRLIRSHKSEKKTLMEMIESLKARVESNEPLLALEKQVNQLLEAQKTWEAQKEELIRERNVAQQRSMLHAFTATLKSTELEKALIRVEELQDRAPSKEEEFTAWKQAVLETMEQKDTLIASSRNELDQMSQAFQLLQTEKLTKGEENDKLIKGLRDRLRKVEADLEEKEAKVKDFQTKENKFEQGIMAAVHWEQKHESMAMERDELFREKEEIAQSLKEHAMKLSQQSEKIKKLESVVGDNITWKEKYLNVIRERDALLERVDAAKESKQEMAWKHHNKVSVMEEEIQTLQALLRHQVESSKVVEEDLSKAHKQAHDSLYGSLLTLQQEEEQKY